MLSEILGYDKYQHVTTEFAIRNTYVDLAVVVDNDTRFLIEVKAIGHDLKDIHVKQVIDYGANQGIEWVVLSNGAVWRTYKIHFGQPIDKSLVFEVDIISANPKSRDVVECFGNLSREGFSKTAMADLFQQKQVTRKYSVAAVLLGDRMVNELRRELRRLSPGLKVEADYLHRLLENEVVKRDLVDSEEAKIANATKKRLQRNRKRERKREEGDREPAPPVSQSAMPQSQLAKTSVT